MDAELVTLAGSAASTVVTLLATDAWEKAKAAMGALWRQVHPDRAEGVEADLVDTRVQVLAARADRDAEAEQELVAEWQGRIRRLLAADPAVAAELRRLLDTELTPALPAGSQVWTGDVHMDATATGHARIYQVGQGTQHITDR